MKVVNDVTGLIGRTPLVRLSHINATGVEIFAKLESFNPGGSIKDRIAHCMIEHAEQEGMLTRDKIVIEPTSGNTGIGLAMVCAAKGYRLTLVMPETMSIERRKILMAFGAKIILTEGGKGMNGASDKAKEIVQNNPDQYFMPNQFDNKYNMLAHYETTGREIWEDTDGQVTTFVGGLGTSGTLMGVSKRLKEYNPMIRIVSVEPKATEIIPGLKNLSVSYIPGIFDERLIDERVEVGLDPAFETARLLAINEGLFCGPSSGAAVFMAIEKAKEKKDKLIVVILPDGGEKYLSTPFLDPSKCLDCILRSKRPSCLRLEDRDSLEKMCRYQ